MPGWLIGFLSGASLAVLGTGLNWLLHRLNQIDAQRAAAAALRFELELNRLWLGDIFTSLNYLRDEAWVRMKNEGYVSYLVAPIPSDVANVYNKLHRLNRRLREKKEGLAKEFPTLEDRAGLDELRAAIDNLIALLDARYSSIGQNFTRPAR